MSRLLPALARVAVFLFLVGCSATTNGPGSLNSKGAVPQIRSAAPAPQATGDTPLLYVSGAWNRSVDIYPQSDLHRRVGQLTQGIGFGGAVAVDAAGYVYLADLWEQDVVVFKHGETSQYRALGTGGRNAVYMAVDSNQDIFTYVGSNQVLEFPDANYPAQPLTTHYACCVTGLAVDAGGTLYASDATGEIDEFPPGQSVANVVAARFPKNISAILFDSSQNLIVASTKAGSSGGTIEIYAPPYTNGSVERASVPSPANSISLSADDSILWAASQYPAIVRRYTYPGLKRVDGTINKRGRRYSQIGGLAVYPASPL